MFLIHFINKLNFPFYDTHGLVRPMDENQVPDSMEVNQTQ